MALLGAFLTIFGGIFIATILVQENKIGYWIFAGFFLLLGLPVTLFSVRDLIRIGSDRLPLLNAIKYDEKDYIVWVYDNQITQKVNGVDVSKSSNVVLYDKNGKMIQVVLSRKIAADPVIDYLASAFPDAYIGYDDETRAAVGKLLNKKL
jgi:hypothetical protein